LSIATPTKKRTQRIGELVALNRGVIGKLFAEINDAEAWLLEQNNKEILFVLH
jgi:hypothetical protein